MAETSTDNWTHGCVFLSLRITDICQLCDRNRISEPHHLRRSGALLARRVYTAAVRLSTALFHPAAIKNLIPIAAWERTTGIVALVLHIPGGPWISITPPGLAAVDFLKVSSWNWSRVVWSRMRLIRASLIDVSRPEC